MRGARPPGWTGGRRGSAAVRAGRRSRPVAGRWRSTPNALRGGLPEPVARRAQRDLDEVAPPCPEPAPEHLRPQVNLDLLAVARPAEGAEHDLGLRNGSTRPASAPLKSPGTRPTAWAMNRSSAPASVLSTSLPYGYVTVYSVLGCAGNPPLPGFTGPALLRPPGWPAELTGCPSAPRWRRRRRPAASRRPAGRAPAGGRRPAAGGGVRHGAGSSRRVTARPHRPSRPYHGRWETRYPLDVRRRLVAGRSTGTAGSRRESTSGAVACATVPAAHRIA